MRPAVYIPHHHGAERLGETLRGLAEQSRPIDVVLVDNGSADGSRELVERDFPEIEIVALGRNVGFGPALNRAIEQRPADPLILLNNDAVPEPRFVEALLGTAVEGAEMVAGVLLEDQPAASGGRTRGGGRNRIDSAGVVADRTLMGFDYLQGEPVEALATAPPPLGPTGGAALYRFGAFRSVGGFDERIFLYYEDLELALRLRAAGGRCELAADARAVHAYSASLGAASGAKYAHTGWSRGYMLRRYGVMSRPGAAARALACEAAICAGQLLRDRTARGLAGRLRGWRDGGGLERRQPPSEGLLDITAREALALRRRRRG
ncbi:MAG TPA: glycosyltransferase family 2 protein [Solirubrobacterales bacterium]|nr:glycosyltransferase family 2 protein [Solirubrobacterales bacterium]